MFWLAEFVLLWVVIITAFIVGFLAGEHVGFADGFEEGTEYGTAEGFEMSERDHNENWFVEYVDGQPKLRVSDTTCTDNLFDAL